MERAAASVTTPRGPEKDIRNGKRQLGKGSTRRTAGINLGKYVAGNTQTKRTRMTAKLTSAPAANARFQPPPDIPEMTARACNPVNKNTSASMLQEIRPQIK